MTGRAASLPAGAQPILDECAEIARRYSDAGRHLYLVGGIVRDLVLGRVTTLRHDFDFTTDATPSETKAILGPVADALWTQGERFGTIAARLARAGSVGDRLVEVTTHRAEIYDEASRKPHVVFSSDVAVDLSRRDFTINALALEVTAAEPSLIDPFGGLADLADRRLRTPLDAIVSFGDDPLRMLRAARFIAQLDVVPEPALFEAIAALGERLDIVSIERVRDEVDKLLVTADPRPGAQFLVDTALAPRFLPELASAIDALVRTPAELETRLAVVLVGSGPAAARKRLRSLRHPGHTVDAVVAACRVADVLASEAGATTDAGVRRIARSGSATVARALAVLGARDETAAAADEFAARYGALGAAEDLEDLGPPVDGGAVMRRLGLEPGPVVGEALAFLGELRLDEGPLTPDDALARLDDWWTARAGR